MDKEFRIKSFKLFYVVFILSIFALSISNIVIEPVAFSKIIYANISDKINKEPNIVNGIVVNIGDLECSIKILSETYRGDILDLSGKCPKDLKKGKRISGFFDGGNFVFLKSRNRSIK